MRPQHDPRRTPGRNRQPSHSAPTDLPHGPRFKVLLTEDREHAIEHWTRQLPRLLGPQGIEAIVARTGREAIDITHNTDIHAALIDLSTPQDTSNRATTATGIPGGLWLLEVLSRLPASPPIVIVNSRTFTERQIQRSLNDALRMGAFSVINQQVNQPVQLELLLEVIQRLMDRQYDGNWPEQKPRDDFSI
ncbi:hypothetical protein [Poriferisphaera sp. WC338]|uniref:hypothetical protein n=1 Tax=Poriferisphaera sp. WC338 TaxID=3425129 RepID=UPI003D818D0A